MKNSSILILSLISTFAFAQSSSNVEGYMSQKWNPKTKEWVKSKIVISQKDKNTKITTTQKWFTMEEIWGNVERKTITKDNTSETTINQNWNVFSDSWVNVNKNMKLTFPPAKDLFSERYNWDLNDWDVISKVFVDHSEKDKYGNIKKMIVSESNGDRTNYKFKYRKFGNTYKVVKIEKSKVGYGFTVNHYLSYEKGRKDYLLSEEIIEDRAGDKKINYTYLPNGSVKKEEVSSDSKYKRIEDKNGKTLFNESYRKNDDGAWELDSYIRSFYDEEGRVIRMERFGYCAGDNDIEVFYYDFENGKLASKRAFYRSIKTEIETPRYKHDYFSKKELIGLKMINPDFLVFPNPNKGQFKVCSETLEIEDAEIQIYDLKGQLKYKQKFEKGSNCHFVRANLLAGVYICKISSGDSNQTLKMLVTGNKVHYP